jgi:hypothetical protein
LAEFFELSSDFIEKVLSRARAKKILQAGPGRVGWESSVFAGDMRYFRWTQNRAAIGAGDVKSYGKPGIFFCEHYRMFERLARDHKAGTCQDSTAVSKDYGFINFPGSAEIIPIYNQTAGFHLLYPFTTEAQRAQSAEDVIESADVCRPLISAH